MENSINISNAFFVAIDYVAKNCNTQAKHTQKKKEKKISIPVYQSIHTYILKLIIVIISLLSLYIYTIQ